MTKDELRKQVINILKDDENFATYEQTNDAIFELLEKYLDIKKYRDY